MRDHLINHYFVINLDLLWQTVTTDCLGCWSHTTDPGARSDKPCSSAFTFLIGV
jgi:hypothetical protein